MYQTEPQYWWLSFSDNDRPKGSRNLGACVVWATSLADACRRAHRLGINPGGEVLGIRLSNQTAAKVLDHVDKLMTPEEWEPVIGPLRSTSESDL